MLLSLLFLYYMLSIISQAKAWVFPGRRGLQLCRAQSPSVKGHSQRFMSHMSTDTIFALSSGPIVKSGVAVVRLSGPSSYYCLEKLVAKHDNKSKTFALEPRKASLRHIYAPDSKEVLDQALVLWFPGPKSFTGEDVVELHLHGSRAVIKGVFEALEYLDSPPDDRAIRPAGPGEFTRRAFENGRMDLTEVEGLSDLLDADTSEQRKQALKQMDGHLRKQYEAWR